MASTIRIKRSGTAGNPSVLASGELAYSAADASGVSGGDRLYVGFGTETNGNAANHIVIGGKYFTDMLDHTKGVVTPDSALVVDENKKINELSVDNLKLDGNTISSTNADGDIILNPIGSGKTIAYNLYINEGAVTKTIDEYVEDVIGGLIDGTPDIGVTYDDINNTTTVSLENTTVTAGTYGSQTQIPTFTVDGKGRLTAAGEVSVATALSVAGNTGSTTINLLNDTVTFTGSAPLSTDVDAGTDTVTLSVDNATTTSVGVASFDANNFTVASGAVTAKDITLGSSTFALGSTYSNLLGLDRLSVDNLDIDGNNIQATDTNGDISLQPNGDGVVDVNDSRISGLNDPSGPKDAANKRYVDEVAQGLQAKPSDDVATTQNLDVIFDGVAGTLTSSSNGVFPLIDGYQLQADETILIKDQNNKYENGSYVLTDIGSSTTPWVLSRASFMDETDEIPGAFEFVTNGNQYKDTGWVAIVPNDFLLNSTEVTADPNGFSTRGDIEWVQFSGAGTFTAGDGLTLDGTEFNVNLLSTGGLEIVADELKLKSSVAGNGLSYSNGVVTVGGTTNRITVGESTIDIASNYAGQTSITTLGTITSGTWNGNVISPVYGGTGQNNGANTITLGGSLVTSGNFTTTLTTTDTTSVTLPNTGTLATLTGAETLENKAIEAFTIGATTPGTGNFTTLEADSVDITDTTNATSATTGALVVAGGAGFSRTVYVGDNLIGSGATTSTIDGFTIDGGTY